MKKYLIYTSLVALAAPFYANATTCSTMPDCAALGYKHSAAQCAGKYTLKCPFDTSKVYCNAKTPVLCTEEHTRYNTDIGGCTDNNSGSLFLLGWGPKDNQLPPYCQVVERISGADTSYGNVNSATELTCETRLEKYLELATLYFRDGISLNKLNDTQLNRLDKIAISRLATSEEARYTFLSNSFITGYGATSDGALNRFGAETSKTLSSYKWGFCYYELPCESIPGLLMPFSGKDKNYLSLCRKGDFIMGSETFCRDSEHTNPNIPSQHVITDKVDGNLSVVKIDSIIESDTVARNVVQKCESKGYYGVLNFNDLKYLVNNGYTAMLDGLPESPVAKYIVIDPSDTGSFLAVATRCSEYDLPCNNGESEGWNVAIENGNPPSGMKVFGICKKYISVE